MPSLSIKALLPCFINPIVSVTAALRGNKSLKGVSFPFKIPRPPHADTSWAGVLHLSGIPWILYEYSEFQKSDTRRKV